MRGLISNPELCFSYRSTAHTGMNSTRCVCVVFINASTSAVQFLEIRYGRVLWVKRFNFVVLLEFYRMSHLFMHDPKGALGRISSEGNVLKSLLSMVSPTKKARCLR